MSDETQRRGTGRTTGLALIAIGQALATGRRTEFIDHEPHTMRSAANHCRSIMGLAERAGLRVDVVRIGRHVYVYPLADQGGTPA